MPLLQIKNLNKQHQKIKILIDVSFTVEAGQVLGVLGESGCGKTTLLKSIAGLLDVDAGELLLHGKKITAPSEKLIAGHDDIKLVRQDYGLFPNISLRENIAYMLRFYEQDYRNERTEHLSNLLGLTTIQHRLPREVSGGEAQRTAIACALAEKPALLLLDEPLSHLDHRNKQILKTEIKQIVAEEQIACIFVTHDVGDLLELADSVLVLQQGQVVQSGTPQDIYQNPTNLYVAALTGDINVIKNELVRPEKIKIVKPEKAQFEAVVVENVFCGHYWKVLCQTHSNRIKLFNPEPINIGETLCLKVSK